MAKEPEQSELRVLRDPDAPEPPPIYANQLQATFTPEDFTLHFGWYTIPALPERPADGVIKAPVQPVARIVIPLNLMKNVIALLQRQVEAYEQSFGAISEHPNKPPWLRELEAASDSGNE